MSKLDEMTDTELDALRNINADLLAALKELVDCAEDEVRYCPETPIQEALADARAAIARAEPENPLHKSPRPAGGYFMDDIDGGGFDAG